MSELLALQNKFQEHLLHADNDIVNDIVQTEKVSTDIRLSIYSHAYRARLQEALTTNYPVLEMYLGCEQFESLAHAYMEMYPSNYKSIRWFGDKLENFLRDNEPYSDFAYLAELAKVEWRMTIVFDAPDSTLATLETLAQIPHESWADMSFIAHPSVSVMQLSWNVIPLWQTMSAEESPTELIESESPVSWVFWRNDLLSYFYSLSADEVAALNVMLEGASFSEICGILCDWVDEQDVAMRAVSFLKGWISSGLIAEIQCK